MSEYKEETSIRVITFDGKKTTWPSWKEKFLARAKKKGYKDILTKKVVPVPETTTIADNDAQRDEKLKARNANENAYADLILSIDTSKAPGRAVFNLIKNTKSNDYPDGYAGAAWEALEKKFDPTTAPSKAKLHRLFFKAKLKKGADPVNFITYLEDVRGRLKEAGTDIGDDMFILQAMNSLTKGYATEIRLMEEKMDAGENITVEQLKDRLSLGFERIQKWSYEDDDDDDSEEEEEKALLATQFKGRCNNCGKYGHKAADCREKKQNNNKNKGKRFHGKCNYCGIIGHKEADCNKKKRDEASSTAADNAATAMEIDDSDEMVMMAMDDFEFDFPSETESEEEDSVPDLHMRAEDEEYDADEDEESVPLLKIDTSKCLDYPHEVDLVYSDTSEEDFWDGMNDMIARIDKIQGELKAEDIAREMLKESSAQKSSLMDEGQTVHLGYFMDEGQTKKLHPGQTTKHVPVPEDLQLLWDEDLTRNKHDSMTSFSGYSETQCDHDETLLAANEGENKQKAKYTSNTWVADSGASCHMTNSDLGMMNVKHIDENVKIGNGKSLKATKVGDIVRTVVQTDGSTQDIRMKAKFVPGLWVNLFSITRALKQGGTLGNDGLVMTIKKGKSLIKFDKIFETKAGYICGAEICPQETSQHAGVTMEEGKTFTMKEVHKIFGHVGEEVARLTAAHYGWVVKGTSKKCPDCGTAKATQTSVDKNPVERSNTPAERLFIDISSIKTKSFGNSKYWLLAIDDCTDHCWSFFLERKKHTSMKIRALIKDLKKKHKKTVKIIRCDNAGENKILEEDCLKDGLGIQFEWTAPGTPQQNGRVERKFATLYGRLRAMMKAVKLPTKIRQGVWAEAARTATLLENLFCTPLKDVPAYERFFGKEHKDARHLRTFGEMAIVANHHNKKTRGKLDDRGKVCMFVGYAKDSDEEVYQFLNLNTKKIVTSRDVSWMGKYYYQHVMDDEDLPPEDSDDFSDTDYDNDMGDVGGIDNGPPNPNPNPDPNPTPAGTGTGGGRHTRSQGPPPVAEKPTGEINRELAGIYEESAINDYRSGRETSSAQDNQAGREEEQASLLLDRLFDEFVFFANEDDFDIEPKSFRQAWDHPDPVKRKKWHDAIHKEFRDMLRRGVWRVMERAHMPGGRRCVKCKWVFTIKRDGRYRARLVACGYSQIPGVDFTEHYSPVIHDVTYRILLVLQIIYGLESRIMDVETAFLHGDLEEEIYMDCPQGMEGGGPDKCVKLQKTIYGLVQSARMFFKKLIQKLKDIGFQQSQADPCLMTWKSELGVVYIAIYVDDCYCVGHKKALDKMEELMKSNTKSVEAFTLKVTESTSDYLGCEVVFSQDKKKAWLGQPHIVANLERKFGDAVKKLQSYKTPGTPGIGLRKAEDGIKVPSEDHSMYRSGVGMLLYLVKHSRPDIANAVREMTKVLDNPTLAAIKEMKRCIKFVLDTKTFGLKIVPTMLTDGHWVIVIYTDSDWAGDKDTRRSVSGFIIYLLGVPISWRSKQQKSVVLSSSEAEFVSLSEAAKEIKFVYQIMQSMGLKIKTPIIVRVDNVGAMFMAENVTTSQRTRHVDIRYNFVREFVEDGFLKIVFVKTDENKSDGFTKNVSGEIYEKHAKDHIIDKNRLLHTDQIRKGVEERDSTRMAQSHEKGFYTEPESTNLAKIGAACTPRRCESHQMTNPTKLSLAKIKNNQWD